MTELLAPTILRPNQPPHYSGPHRFDSRIVIEATQFTSCLPGSFEQPSRVQLLLSNDHGETWAVAASKPFLNGAAASKQTLSLTEYRHEIPTAPTCLRGWPPGAGNTSANARFHPSWTDFALVFDPPTGANPGLEVVVLATTI
jgi:hypothetical protein